MMPIFIDTGAFLSRYLENDQFHLRSARTWKELEKEGCALYTSNFIFNEVFTLLSRRAGATFATKVANSLYSSDILQILRPGKEDELLAVKLMEKYSDQQIGFTDCISSVLMHKYKLTSCFTFDHHFHILKFNIIPAL